MPVFKSLVDGVFQSTTATPARFAFFWRPAATHLLLGFATVLALISGMPARYLALLSPAILNTASLVPLSSSQDFRYQYSMVLTAPLVLAFLIGWIEMRLRSAKVPC